MYREINISSNPAITDIVYTNGLVTSFKQDGVTWTVTYDSSNRPQVISNGRTTRTAVYNSDGTVASWS